MSARRWWQGERRIAARCVTCGAAIAVGDEAATLEHRAGAVLSVCGACVAKRKKGPGR